MKKRIEEFTANELRSVYSDLSRDDGMLAVLDYIKANLDTGKREPMSVEEIRDRTGFPIVDCQKIQPLTVQQGFVPDWSKAPKDAKTFVGIFSRYDEREFKEANRGSSQYMEDFPPIFISRPSQNMRQKTRVEKVLSLFGSMPTGLVTVGSFILNKDAVVKLSDASLDDLCRAAGIPLEVTE